MIRKIQLLIAVLVLGTSLSAQITVTSASFPEPGDTLRTTFDAMPSGIDLLENGGDQVWDFTSLAGINQETIIRPASDGDNFNQFPAADILVGEPGGLAGELYYNSTSTAYDFLGYVGADPAGFGVSIVAKLNPPSPERRSPMNFFDVNSADNNITVAFSSDLLPGGVLDSFALSPDSLRIRITTERLDVVDAWGTLSIPAGTYEVLREKREEERETRLDVYVGIGPFAEWIDVTDLVGFDFLGVDTIHTYHFFSDQSKETIAVVTVDPITDDPTTVTYKSGMNATTSVVNYADKGKADIFAYPNPAINDVRFDFINLPTDTYNLKIYNILGVEVYSQKYNIANRRTIKMDLSNMRKGTYLYSLLDSRGKPVTTKRLVVMKP